MSIFPYMIDAEVKPKDSTEIIIMLGKEFAYDSKEVIVRVPFMRKTKDDPGEYYLTIRPYALLYILLSRNCFEEYIKDKNTELIGYSLDPLQCNYFSSIKYFVSEELFAYINTMLMLLDESKINKDKLVYGLLDNCLSYYLHYYSGAEDEISIFDLAEIVDKFISSGYKLADEGIAIKEAVKCLMELKG